ncbi:hypothetical protein LR814_13100 [Furfurilactobacillus rossiae]|nr:NlpC/P60 family protein [Furfurilactobacillus rossiae]QFR67974.1 hypothetical protein LR814_13100 [Furfurilactobacillus rossiae]
MIEKNLSVKIYRGSNRDVMFNRIRRDLLLFSVGLGFLGLNSFRVNADMIGSDSDVNHENVSTTNEADITKKNAMSVGLRESSVASLQTKSEVSQNPLNEQKSSSSQSVISAQSVSTSTSSASGANSVPGASSAGLSEIVSTSAQNAQSNFSDENVANNSVGISKSESIASSKSDSQSDNKAFIDSDATVQVTSHAVNQDYQTNQQFEIGNESSKTLKVNQRAINLSFMSERESTEKNQWVENTDGSRSYLDQNGNVVRNTFLSLKNHRYYFDADGRVKEGLFSANGTYYFADWRDNIVVQDDFRQNNNSWFYFKTDGAIARGLTWVPRTKEWNYYDNGTYQIVKDDFRENNNSWFYFKPDGEIAHGLTWVPRTKEWNYYDNGTYQIVKDDFRENNNSWFYFKPDGEIAHGLTWVPRTKEWNYYDNGTYQIVKDDFRENNNSWFYFKPDGGIAQGLTWVPRSNTWNFYDYGTYQIVKDDFRENNNSWFYFKPDGGIAQGLTWVPRSNTWNFYDYGTYQIVKDDFRENNNSWFYFKPDGGIAQGLTWVPRSNTWNFYDYGTYQIIKNDYRQNNGSWFYFTNDGSIGRGLVNTNSGWQYFDPVTYQIKKNSFVMINNKKYYFDSNGNRVVGSVNINGLTYGTDSNGAINDSPEAISTLIKTLYSEIGKPYVWGASGPSAFDCSGLVQYAYAAAGISLPRVTTQQERVGYHVGLNNLRTGDLLFWGSVGDSYHVAVYIGNWQMIEAPYPGATVHVTSLNGWTPDFATRVL